MYTIQRTLKLAAFGLGALACVALSGPAHAAGLVKGGNVQFYGSWRQVERANAKRTDNNPTRSHISVNMSAGSAFKLTRGEGNDVRLEEMTAIGKKRFHGDAYPGTITSETPTHGGVRYLLEFNSPEALAVHKGNSRRRAKLQRWQGPFLLRVASWLKLLKRTKQTGYSEKMNLFVGDDGRVEWARNYEQTLQSRKASATGRSLERGTGFVGFPEESFWKDAALKFELESLELDPGDQ